MTENLKKESMPDYWHELALSEKSKGNQEKALHFFLEALRRINRFYPSFNEVIKYSNAIAAEAMVLKQEDKVDEAIGLYVRAIELNPDNSDLRKELEELLSKRSRLDYTKHCFIDRKGERARLVRYETYLRCIEFLTTSGITGDILEFGVLAGWSSRLFAEIIRDEMFLGDLHLFDSFEGLPLVLPEIDAKSYEISGRNLWRDNMKFSDDFIAHLGTSIEDHIKTSLSQVLSPKRIHIHKGFYNEVMKEELQLKAALVHIDCDLYQSTIDILQGLARQKAFQDGSVLIFDDWNCNKANPNFGERRAFKEFLEKYSNLYDASLFFTYGHNGAVYILHCIENN